MNILITNTKKGSIGITIVMLIFCLLMSVSMSYHKTLQTENLIQDNSNYSDRALDAAFSGVNYAMAVIQSNKGVFDDDNTKKVLITNNLTSPDSNTIIIPSNWIYSDQNSTYTYYYDEDIEDNTKKHIPTYRFIVSCGNPYYYSTKASHTVYIKSYGEYIKYEGNTIVASYSTQLMAECDIATITKTLKLTRYRKMKPQINNLSKFYNCVIKSSKFYYEEP